MIFETKKIQLETLAEYLSEVRQSVGLSVLEVSQQTNIKPKFLENLESGTFSKLPADVYVYGFLKQLSALYAVDATALIEQYKKERAIERQMEKKTKFEAHVADKLFQKVIITPKIVTTFVALLFIAATLGYVIWQVFSINKTPILEIYEPQDRQVIKNSVVTVKGKTDPGMSVTINDQSVFVTSSGGFQTQVGLNNGPKTLVFVAKNKFDKSTTKSLTVIGEVPISEPAAIEGGVVLRLEFTGEVTLDFKLDDGALQTLFFSSGDTKVLTARDIILVSTNDAGATRVTYNNQPLGFLGKSQEKLTNVPFVKQETAPQVPPPATSTEAPQE